MGASAAYRQVALVGGSAARHSRKSKWGGAACEPKQEGEESGGCGVARGASRWVCVWQEPVNKRLSTRARPTGPSVERYLVWYGSSSGGRLQRRCACGVRAVCVRCACGVRARRLPSETRRRVCHVSSGDQHRSSKMDSSVGEAVGGPWAWLWAWVRWVLCCAVRPLSRQGISTACPLGTDLGMKVDLPRPPRGAGQVGVVQGGSAGRGRLFRDARRCRLRLCTRGTTPCRCRALTCSGRSWVDTRA